MDRNNYIYEGNIKNLTAHGKGDLKNDELKYYYHGEWA